MTFTFTLNRFNTKQGEPILVYSKPTQTSAKRTSLTQLRQQSLIKQSDPMRMSEETRLTKQASEQIMINTKDPFDDNDKAD